MPETTTLSKNAVLVHYQTSGGWQEALIGDLEEGFSVPHVTAKKHQAVTYKQAVAFGEAYLSGAGRGIVPAEKGKLYDVIYADPPWLYNDSANAGNRGAVHKYPCLDAGSIAGLTVDGRAVQEIAAPNAALFMWATAPLLPTAFETLAAWGFEYKTVAFTWVKVSKAGKPRWGMGNWTRANAEFCLLGIRGKGPKRVSAAVHSTILSETRGHSRKPVEARNRIGELLDPLPPEAPINKIELFSRDMIEGWDFWGYDVDASLEVYTIGGAANG